jgi:hypothetical protein
MISLADFVFDTRCFMGSPACASGRMAKSLSAPIVPREAPQLPQETIASREARSGFSIFIPRLPQLPHTI